METYSHLAMSCPQNLTISQTIRWLRRRWHTVKIGWSRVFAKDINNGSCGDFAAAVLEAMSIDFKNHYTYLRSDPDAISHEWSGVRLGNIFPDVEKKWHPFGSKVSWPGHYFLEWEGMFYDAECPDGVANWYELPIFQRYMKKLADKICGQLTLI